MRFGTEEARDIHKNFHYKSHKCILCDLSFPSQSSLRKHCQSQHMNGDMYECKICNYQTKRYGRIKVHMTVHYKEQSKIPCTYKECDFMSKDEDSLDRWCEEYNFEKAISNVLNIV